VASTDGRQVIVEQAEGTIADPEALADTLAARLRQLGAHKLMPLQPA
jgi:porphobilinogen deaminase